MFTYGKTMMRPIEEHDLETLRLMRNEQSTWMMLRSIKHVSEEDQRIWFRSLWADKTRAYYVVEDAGGGFVGMIRTDEYDPLNRSVRVGADVAPALRGQGWGTAIYTMLLKWCFDYLNCHRVWLCVLNTNVAGKALYAKVGFKEEGRYRDAYFRDGCYVDELVMSVLEDEYRTI